jgi:hypothetical protein
MTLSVPPMPPPEATFEAATLAPNASPHLSDMWPGLATKLYEQSHAETRGWH